MGRIAVVLKYISENVNKLRVTLGGSNESFTEIVTPAGFESVPLKNDRAFVVEGKKTGSYKYLGVLSRKHSLSDGETRIFARNSAGEIVASVTLYEDGEILVGNGGNLLMVKADGSLEHSSGAIITTDGDFVSALGVSLNSHTHPVTTAPGTTGAPIPGGI